MLVNTKGGGHLDMRSPTERSPPGTNRQPAVVSAVSPQQDPSGPVLAWWLSGTPGFLSEPARGGGGRGEAYPLTHYKASASAPKSCWESAESYGVLPAQDSDPVAAEVKSLFSHHSAEPLVFPVVLIAVGEYQSLGCLTV